MSIEQKIIELLNGNKQGGFFAAEIAHLINEPFDEVRLVLQNNPLFYYDNEFPK